MDLSSRHRPGRIRRGLGVFALLAFLLGTEHCAVMGLAGRDCGRPTQALRASSAQTPAAHACCAARHAASRGATAPATAPDASCCLQPAPLPVAAQLSAPADIAFLPLAVLMASRVAPDAPTRVAAPPPDVGSPPGASTPEPSLGRAPPLA